MLKRKMVLGNKEIMKNEFEKQLVAFETTIKLLARCSTRVKQEMIGETIEWNIPFYKEISEDEECGAIGRGIASAWEIVADLHNVNVRCEYNVHNTSIRATFV